MEFTGNKDTDYLVLLQLSDNDLGKVCSANKYFRLLCQNDNFWRNRTFSRFAKHFEEHQHDMKLYNIPDNISDEEAAIQAQLSSEEKGQILRNIVDYKETYGYQTWKDYYISLINFLETLYYQEVHSKTETREDFKILSHLLGEDTLIFIGQLGDELEHIKDLHDFEEKLNRYLDEQLRHDLISPSSLYDAYFLNDIEKKVSLAIFKYMIQSKDPRFKMRYTTEDNETPIEVVAKHIANDDNNYTEENILIFDMYLSKYNKMEEELIRIATDHSLPAIIRKRILTSPLMSKNKLLKIVRQSLSHNHYYEEDNIIFEVVLQKGISLETIITGSYIDNIDEFKVFISSLIPWKARNIRELLLTQKYSEEEYDKILTILSKK